MSDTESLVSYFYQCCSQGQIFKDKAKARTPKAKAWEVKAKASTHNCYLVRLMNVITIVYLVKILSFKGFLHFSEHISC